MNGKEVSKGFWILFFVFPGLAVVFVFILMPLFVSLFNSFFNWQQLLRSDFIGFDNFKTLFFSYPYNERFFNALRNNVKWFLTTMIIQNSLGMLFGYMLSRRIPGQEFFKRVFFIPVLFSIVAVSFLWGLYLRPNGLINEFLKFAGLGNLVHAWLGEEKLATFSIIAVSIWRWVGFPSLVFLAAIDGVPVDCIEAAYLDGVGEWKMFWRIVFPLILSSVTVIAVLTIIGSLNVFEQIFTMTGPEGGPNYSTDTLGTMFYRTAFGGVDSGNPAIGIGSAVGTIIYIATFLISIVSIMATKSREVEL
ncbi:MAG: sugar ABC transporter permease [Spirochaetaceae bacterium]|jgi:raffinose/stachyose/melibiose transport system permease protein|nr:sugar ABC transporter permease [Spirochaetaceae bacterium]